MPVTGKAIGANLVGGCARRKMKLSLWRSSHSIWSLHHSKWDWRSNREGSGHLVGLFTMLQGLSQL